MLAQWNKDSIQALLGKSDKFLERALLKIYERQTKDEQVAEIASHSNGVGFTGVDAEFLSKLAVWVLNSSKREGERLSNKQKTIVRAKMMKYHKQLVQIANG